MSANKYSNLSLFPYYLYGMAKTTNPKGAGRKPLEVKNVKTSLFINEDFVKAIKYLAYLQDTTRTDIVNTALGEFIEKWEKKNGPIPKK